MHVIDRTVQPLILILFVLQQALQYVFDALAIHFLFTRHAHQQELFLRRDIQPVEQAAQATVKRRPGAETFPAIPVYRTSLHIRSMSCKALNLHLSRQSPQAVHRSGYFTVACIPVSSSTISSARRGHFLTQRRHPEQFLSSTSMTFFLRLCLRCILKEIHSKAAIPIPIYTVFIVYRFYCYLFMQTNEP
jgi:hypothetical protein